jgi:hypothetical protein
MSNFRIESNTEHSIVMVARNARILVSYGDIVAVHYFAQRCACGSMKEPKTCIKENTSKTTTKYINRFLADIGLTRRDAEFHTDDFFTTLDLILDRSPN